MNLTLSTTIRNKAFIFHAHRAVYLPFAEVLVVSDVHLGKTTHFRKHGLSVPQQVAVKDLERLSGLVDEFQPKKMVIAGDFFHAEANSELDLFAKWREQSPNVSVVLVKGNHDRLAKGIYQSLGIEVYEEQYFLDDLVITHEYQETIERFQISGHIHPGIVLKGKGKQKLRLPVFAYNPKHLLLPAFSLFTGLDTRMDFSDYQLIGVHDEGVFKI